MKYEADRAAVVMSVGELCAYALMGGDLDLRPGMGSFATPERAALGADVHRKLQAEAGAMYTAEVAMTHTEVFSDVCFEINGRADGILSTEFDNVYTFELYSGESTTALQTLTYSVNTYAYRMQNHEDESGEISRMAELARALYRYGKSAEAFIAD
jgi:hypothetical protein